jgi:hypothetical protein
MGFTNSDGSSLIGAMNPSNVGQSLKVDNSGNLMVTSSGGAGSVVNIADPNTPANKLAIDASGRLTLAPNQSINIAQIAGAAPSASNTLPTANYIGGVAVSTNNPYPSADQIRLWIQNGQGFSCTTGKLTASGAITAGFSVYNPSASGKLIIVFAIEVMIGNTSFSSLNFVSGGDPAFGTSMTAANRRNGSGTTSIASLSYSNSNQASPPGTSNTTICGASNTPLQALQNGDAIFLNANTGIALLPNLSAANSWCVSCQWLEI